MKTAATDSRDEYTNTFPREIEVSMSLDLGDLHALARALDRQCERFGYAVVHEEVFAGPDARPYAPGSHVGHTLAMRIRVDRALHARKFWNREPSLNVAGADR